MIRIRIFADWCDSKSASEKFIECCRLLDDTVEEYGRDYCFTNDDDYTHAMLLNKAMPKLSIPKENVIGLACEPPVFLRLTKEFIEYAEKYIGKYYIGDTLGGKLGEPFIEGNAYLWFNTPPRVIPEKTKWMSIMISQKGFAPGHKYRHMLTQAILQTDLPIDIYGRGCVYYKNIRDDRIKGNFEENEPYVDYEYHIAIENFQTPQYFSEKISNTLLCEATPVYLGCSNIRDYFGDNVILLTGNVAEDMKMLRELYENRGKIKREHVTQKEILDIVSINTCIRENYRLV